MKDGTYGLWYGAVPLVEYRRMPATRSALAPGNNGSIAASGLLLHCQWGSVLSVQAHAATGTGAPNMGRGGAHYCCKCLHNASCNLY